MGRSATDDSCGEADGDDDGDDDDVEDAAGATDARCGEASAVVVVAVAATDCTATRSSSDSMWRKS